MTVNKRFKDLVLHYQPVVSVDTKNVFGFEALCRLKPPFSQLIYPDTFIPHLNCYQLNQLDIAVIKKCISTASALQNSNPSSALFINLNGLFNVRRWLTDALLSILNDAVIFGKINPATIVFEVSEQTTFHSDTHTLRSIMALKSLGFKIALDDYGSKNSNLFRLCTIPCDFLKIDMSITHLLDSEIHRDRTISILQSIRDFTLKQNVIVIIEGIETESQHQDIKTLGFTLSQGYFYSKPQPLSLLTQQKINDNSDTLRYA